jgi:hypothetical protein
MLVKDCGTAFGLVIAALVSWSGSAMAQEPSQTNAECASAYEQSQVQRKSGELIAARSRLQVCARDECPEFIRTDCTAWYAEVQEEVPTLVFAARSQGRDVSDVQVALGDRVLAARLDGQVVELDPGEYDFVFRAPSQRSLTQHFVIARGERNRLIEVELQPLAASVAEEPAARPMARPRSLLVPGILAGVGVLGVGGFAGLGAWGYANENRLHATCAPSCSDSRVSEVRTKYLLADVSLGVGLASFAVSTYLFFSGGGTSQAQGAASPSRWVVMASKGGAGFAYGSNF